MTKKGWGSQKIPKGIINDKTKEGRSQKIPKGIINDKTKDGRSQKIPKGIINEKKGGEVTKHTEGHYK